MGNPSFAPGERSRLWQNRPPTVSSRPRGTGRPLLRSCFSITAAQKHSATSCSNWCLPTARVYPRLTVKSRKNPIFHDRNALGEECIAGAFSIGKSPFFPSQEPGKTPKKCPYCVTGAQKGEFMRTGLTKQEKTTDIWFDEKNPIIHIRTHNTDLKKRLAAYAGQHPDQCRQTDADPETGCMEFDIAKGRFSFRLTAPYSEERRRVASKAAKAHSNNLLRPIPKV